MNANDVCRALAKRYSDHRRYAVAYEVGLTTGGSRRRLDMMVLDCYNSNNFRIDGIEVKVSKADLRRELEDPDKHTAFFDYIDFYTLACPEGVADLSLIPPKWGVLLCREDGTTRYKRKPLALHDEVRKTVPRGFFASVTRAIQGRDPGTQAMLAEHQAGYDEGWAACERHKAYMSERLKKESEKLKAYDDIQSRFHLWGDDPTEKIDQFERFMAGWVGSYPGKLRSWAKQMDDMADKMEGLA